MTDKIELAKEILLVIEPSCLMWNGEYSDRIIDNFVETAQKLAKMVLDEPQNLVWITREEMKEFSDLHQASLDVELAKQEQREKAADMLLELAIQRGALSRIGKVLVNASNKIRNG